MNTWKGQGIIGEIVIFGVSIMMALGMYYIFASVDHETSHDIDFSVAHNVESAVDESDATILLQQELEGSGVNNDYNGLSAYEVTSIYLSTYEDPIINGNEIDRDEVENDLENYYEEKMNFMDDHGEVVEYRHIEIEPEHGGKIEFGEKDDVDIWNLAKREIQTSDGSAIFRFWTGRDGTVGGIS